MIDTTIHLNFNIDGLSLFKSSGTCFWPILGAVKDTVFPVAIYQGTEKPPLDAFFQKFIAEFLELSKNGLSVRGKSVQIKLDYFICDSPARAFVKRMKQFNGSHGCDKCHVVGKSVCRRMVFKDTTSQRRTDHSFRSIYGLVRS